MNSKKNKNSSRKYTKSAERISKTPPPSLSGNSFQLTRAWLERTSLGLKKWCLMCWKSLKGEPLWGLVSTPMKGSIRWSQHKYQKKLGTPSSLHQISFSLSRLMAPWFKYTDVWTPSRVASIKLPMTFDSWVRGPAVELESFCSLKTSQAQVLCLARSTPPNVKP